MGQEKPRGYSRVSMPKDLLPRVQVIAKEEGFEESVSSYLGILTRAMLALREEDYGMYSLMVREANKKGWGWLEGRWDENRSDG